MKNNCKIKEINNKNERKIKWLKDKKNKW
jgi:hypothetical protein